MESKNTATHKWSIRRLFSRPPPQPRLRLLDQLAIEPEMAHTAHAISNIVERGRDRGYCPIAVLPEELVQRIFRAYLDALDRTPTTRFIIKYSYARLHAPFLLSSVCRGWRTHALASPLLWTHVVVPALVPGYSIKATSIHGHVKKEFKQFNKRWIKLVQLLLARSGSAGLHIIILTPRFLQQDPYVENEFELHRQALIALNPHRTRVRTLRMSFNGGPISSIWDIIGTCHVGADGTLNLDAPHLERLELRLTNPESPSAVHLNAPRLRVCEMEQVTCLFPQQSHLVRLEVSITPETWETRRQMVLACALTLEELHLHFLHFFRGGVLTHPADREPLSKTTFPRLSHFGITNPEYTSRNILAGALGIVSAPMLRSAYFALIGGSPSSPTLVEFLKYLDSSSNGAVENLAVSYEAHGDGLDIGDARTIVGHLPSIKVLTVLHPSRIAAGFLGAMHHLAPHVQIQLEVASVLLPISSPQEQLSVAVETLRHDDGRTSERKVAFFDVTWPTRDYDTSPKTENIYPDEQCMVQDIYHAVVVWNDRPVVSHESDEEHLLEPRYRIIPSQLGTTDDPHGCHIIGCFM